MKPSYLQVKERSGGVCERCQSRRGEHVHHKKRRSQGGEDTPENLLHLCFACHNWVHLNPREAWRGGWLWSGKFEAGRD